MAPKNEAALCDMVVARFEDELSDARAEVTYPEKDKSGPPVEMRLRIGATRFAVEHTRIEPFERHIESGVVFGAFAAPLRAALKGAMPSPGVYELCFDLEPLAGIRRSKHAQLRAKIETWARKAAAELHAEAPVRRSRHHAPFGDKGMREEIIDTVRARLTREVHWRHSGEHDGKLLISRMGPSEADIELLRAKRIERALDEKCPKLADCAALGDDSVLILEMDDFLLSNEVLIADALAPLLQARADKPKHVFLADTTIEGDWELITLVENGVFVFAP